MKIIFAHGQESGPWGTKIQYLADLARDHGHQAESIDYQGIQDPDERVAKLLQVLAAETDLSKIILVGSSMGGYVSLQAAARYPVAATLLLAPAIYMPGYEHKAPNQPISNLHLVHGWQDEVIPVDHSIKFANQQRATLHLVNDDHRLIDSLPRIGDWLLSILMGENNFAKFSG